MHIGSHFEKPATFTTTIAPRGPTSENDPMTMDYIFTKWHAFTKKMCDCFTYQPH